MKVVLVYMLPVALKSTLAFMETRIREFTITFSKLNSLKLFYDIPIKNVDNFKELGSPILDSQNVFLWHPQSY